MSILGFDVIYHDDMRDCDFTYQGIELEDYHDINFNVYPDSLGISCIDDEGKFIHLFDKTCKFKFKKHKNDESMQ